MMPCASRPLTFSVRRFADFGLAVPASWFCPAGRAFFLLLNKKKQKINTGATPLCTRKVKGRVTTVSHLILCTGAKTLTPDVIVLETPMVKGGGIAGMMYY